MATKPIERCIEDDYRDYDGEELADIEEEAWQEFMDEWDNFNDSFNW